MKPNILSDWNSDYPSPPIIDGHAFEYRDGFEIGMGGQTCGTFYVDGVKVNTDQYGKTLFKKRDKAYFGTTFFLFKEKIFIPLFHKREFQMSCISLYDLSIKTFGPKEGVMMIQEVKDGKVIYSNHGKISLGLRSIEIPKDCL